MMQRNLARRRTADPTGKRPESRPPEQSTSLTLTAKERQRRFLRRLHTFLPVTDASCDTDSYHWFAEGCFLARKA